jgi:hypothetical protein
MARDSDDSQLTRREWLQATSALGAAVVQAAAAVNVELTLELASTARL